MIVTNYTEIPLDDDSTLDLRNECLENRTGKIGYRCNVCNTTIVSTRRHDFQSCNCDDNLPVEENTNIFIDGGWDYLRGGAGVKADFKQIFIVFEEPSDIVKISTEKMAKLLEDIVDTEIEALNALSDNTPINPNIQNKK